MNWVEKIIYDTVKNNPVLKQRIVDVYQGVMGFVPQRKIVTSWPHVVRDGFFFGFHDKTPFSPDGELLLAHRNLIGDRTVSAGDTADVGFFTGGTWNEYHCVSRTRGWNWQLGSMLQWYDPSQKLIAFNDVINGRVRGIICDPSGERTELSYPLVHVTADGRYACSYNFSRVETAIPGYGIVTDKPEHGENETDYFRIFCCETGEVTFRISLSEAASIQPHPSMDGAFHFFHHALFNPSGDRAFFLHRWVDRNERRWTRMFSAGISGESLFLFPMNEMVSHITWVSDTELFAYLRYPGRGDGYFLAKDRSTDAEEFFRGVLDSDGHPTMDKGRSIVITDTYPDRFRNQHLVLMLSETGRRINLCRTHLPKRFRRELQVDLHPRLHPTKMIACFDSGHTGTRSLVTLDFNGAVA